MHKSRRSVGTAGMRGGLEVMAAYMAPFERPENGVSERISGLLQGDAMRTKLVRLVELALSLLSTLHTSAPRPK